MSKDKLTAIGLPLEAINDFSLHQPYKALDITAEDGERFEMSLDIMKSQELQVLLRYWGEVDRISEEYTNGEEQEETEAVKDSYEYLVHMFGRYAGFHIDNLKTSPLSVSGAPKRHRFGRVAQFLTQEKGWILVVLLGVIRLVVTALIAFWMLKHFVHPVQL